MESNNSNELVVEDPLGFTNQTRVLLTGMGASELIPQCQRRNISTETLATLPEEELKLLGANSELAHIIWTELRAVSQRINHRILTDQTRFDQLTHILVNGSKHLTLLQAFITYTKLRLKKERVNSYLDVNQNLQSSEALHMAITTTLHEIHDARSTLQDLKILLKMEDDRRKQMAFYVGTLTGIGLLTYVLLRKFV